jgi:hypothetical protein
MTDSVPEKLGKYEIIEEVGRGGFAAVYRAVDTTLDRTVALKVLAPHLLWDPTFVQRFQQEAKVAANLDHPNIVTIYEVSQIEGVYLIAMQFLEGRTLSQILEAEGLLPVSGVQAVMEQMASALDYAHARGFVHRDIKPSNVIVAEDGRATLTDFGLVKAGEGTQLTASGMVFGTPEYMSPEQAEGAGDLDARSDIYSLGVVVYEMITGKVPFSGTTPLSIMRGHADKSPPRPAEINPDVSPAVEAVLLKALAKKREERYQSAEEMAAALQQAVSGAVVEEVKAPPEPEKPAIVPVPPPATTTPSPRARRVALPPLLVITIGWAIGWAIGLTTNEVTGLTIDEAVVWSIGWAIGGLVTGLALRRTEPPIPWKLTLMIVVGWLIGWDIILAIGEAMGEAIDEPIVLAIFWAIGGASGGLITGLALRWLELSIHWKQVLTMVIGWAIGGAVGLVATLAIVEAISENDWVPVIAGAVGGAMFGAIGGGVMFWRRSRARRKA